MLPRWTAIGTSLWIIWNFDFFGSQPTGRIDVVPNLASTLCTLRKCNNKRLVWCDSICINQSDVVEHLEQVQRMSDIYRYAKRVVVWLGPEAPWTGLVMETVRRVASETISVELCPVTHGLRHKIILQGMSWPVDPHVDICERPRL